MSLIFESIIVVVQKKCAIEIKSIYAFVIFSIVLCETTQFFQIFQSYVNMHIVFDYLHTFYDDELGNIFNLPIVQKKKQIKIRLFLITYQSFVLNIL